VSSFQDPSHAGSYAVDGDMATYWQSDKAVGSKARLDEWIAVDLGSSVSLNRVVLEWHDFYATSYTIEVSNDNSNWSRVYTNIVGDGATDELLFSETTARYLRLVTTSWISASWRDWLRELRVYGPGGQPVTPTSTPTPTATATVAGGSSVHIGDLDAAGFSLGGSWLAQVTVLVHDSAENPVANALVEGT
jgi:hypothetical protein